SGPAPAAGPLQAAAPSSGNPVTIPVTGHPADPPLLEVDPALLQTLPRPLQPAALQPQ
ncbi:hypothetical protein M9458_003657, partial [Cirrhinus mrigala]